MSKEYATSYATNVQKTHLSISSGLQEKLESQFNRTFKHHFIK
jgi:hypothetical protein